MGWLCLVYENISLHQHEKADLCCMRLCFLCMMPLKYKRLSHLIIGFTRCQKLYVVPYSLIKSYLSEEHISTFNSSPESRRTNSSKSVWMHHLASLLPNFSKQFQRPNHRSNSFRMHHLASFLLTFSEQFRLPKHRFK